MTIASSVLSPPANLLGPLRSKISSLKKDDAGGMLAGVLVALAVGGLLAVTVGKEAMQAVFTVNANTLSSELDLLARRGQEKFRKQSVYPTGAYTNDIGPDLGAAWWNGSAITNGYGGTVTYTGATSGGVSVTQLVYPAAPKEACEDWLLNTPLGTGLYKQVTIGSGSAITATVTTAGAAGTACPDAANTLTVEVFKR